MRSQNALADTFAGAAGPHPDSAEEVAAALEFVRLSHDEIDHLAALAKFLGGSPRRVKRFINLYRLIKMGLPPYSQAELTRPEAMAALLVNLTISTGAPAMAPHYFAVIKDAKTLDAVCAEMTRTADEMKDADWNTVGPALANSGVAIETLREWAVLARRYSFTTGLARRNLTPPPSSPAIP